MATIVVVEDERELNDIMCMYLRDAGYMVYGCLSADEAYAAMHGRIIDLVISDIMMPGIDGFEFAAKLRRMDDHLPIIFVTARDDMAAKRHGFHTGVDDYMVKPIELDELVLRVEALLRRAGIEESHLLKVGGFEMNATEMSAQLDGRPVELTVREFNILYKLLSYPRQVFSRGRLMDEFWGQDADNNLRVTDVYITRLRQKFAGCPYFSILTVRGLGYKAVPNQ
ncbi:response regulator transcription factor [Bifidobacterium amazonense]|uniref:Response regulator transcription factor n=1 Tax=Bifidobacterium amazonense TaxID=2809027 RepID=A0ABS9VXF2_9BIFI|nr:response regulator transcription factor [Bifidobacterium amazonense]MCH9276795.1 response regulator transcription factor [Bifidobacterium amazonense]